jgi:hypothetical protein
MGDLGLRYYSQSAADTGTCATTTCHMSNTGSSDDWAHKWMTPANYTNTTASCTGCHGSALASANLGNTGVTHLAIDTQHNTGTTYECMDCHNLEGGSGYTFTFDSADWSDVGETSTHGDGSIQVNSSGTAYDTGTGYCTNCHTSGAFNFADTAWPIASAAGDALSANCGSCHGYPPKALDGKDNYAAGEGKGAHEQHTTHLGTLDIDNDVFLNNTVCGQCHDVTSAANHSTGSVLPADRNISMPTSYQFGGSAPSFTGTPGTSSSVTTKTCSNVSCHFKETPIWSTIGGE